MTDIQVIRMLTGNDAISDDFIAFWLDSTRQFILGYCNITTIPEGLKKTLLEIAAFRVNANCNGASATLGQGGRTVGSLSDGNQSVSYATPSSGVKQFVSEEDIVAAYGHILDRYRRMVVDHKTHKDCGCRKLRY